MAFDGNEGGPISQQEAVQLVTTFRQNNSGQVKGVYFDKTVFQTLLAQSGASGIRLYFGEENSKMTVVMVAADQNENDIIGTIMDRAAPCPMKCSTTGPLK